MAQQQLIDVCGIAGPIGITYLRLRNIKDKLPGFPERDPDAKGRRHYYCRERIDSYLASRDVLKDIRAAETKKRQAARINRLSNPEPQAKRQVDSALAQQFLRRSYESQKTRALS